MSENKQPAAPPSSNKEESKSSISQATSYEEMGEFWDTHDSAEYEDEGYDVEFEVDLQKEEISSPVRDMQEAFLIQQQKVVEAAFSMIANRDEWLKAIEQANIELDQAKRLKTGEDLTIEALEINRHLVSNLNTITDNAEVVVSTLVDTSKEFFQIVKQITILEHLRTEDKNSLQMMIGFLEVSAILLGTAQPILPVVQQSLLMAGNNPALEQAASRILSVIGRLDKAIQEVSETIAQINRELKRLIHSVESSSIT